MRVCEYTIIVLDRLLVMKLAKFVVFYVLVIGMIRTDTCRQQPGPPTIVDQQK